MNSTGNIVRTRGQDRAELVHQNFTQSGQTGSSDAQSLLSKVRFKIMADPQPIEDIVKNGTGKRQCRGCPSIYVADL